MASQPTDWALQYAIANSGMYGPNQYEDPRFQNQPMPMPGYQLPPGLSTPTNAMGQQIQPPPGITLNTPPPQSPAAAPAQQQRSQTFQNIGPDTGAPQYARPGGSGTYQGSTTVPIYDASGSSSMGQHNALAAMGLNSPLLNNSTTAQGAQGQQGAPGSSPSLDTALGLLSNPGPVTTPGANVPQTPPLGSQQPSVLDQFLAAKQGGQGAGNYNNQGFFNTLNALQGGSATPTGMMAANLNPSIAAGGPLSAMGLNPYAARPGT